MEEKNFKTISLAALKRAVKGLGRMTDILIFITFLSILILLSSCRTKYIPIEITKTEYISKTDSFIQRDSVYLRDSVLIQTKGDTVFVNKWKLVYKDKWRDRILRDTIIRVDSIQVPYPVEKQLTKWQSMKMQAGGISLFFCLILIVCLVLGLLIRKKVSG